MYWRIVSVVIFIFLAFKSQSEAIIIDSSTKLMMHATSKSISGKTKIRSINPLDYAPYHEDRLFFTKRTIRMIVHFMDVPIGKYNITEERATTWTKYMIENANLIVETNAKIKPPVDNEIPILKPYNQYVLTPDPSLVVDDGSYHYYDDELYYYLNYGRHRNKYSKKVIKKYGIRGDELVNIYMISKHPDSVVSKTYKHKNAEVALGTDVKLAGTFGPKIKGRTFDVNLNHQKGHVMKINDSWNSGEGCEDTPLLPNCWSNNSCKEKGHQII